MTDMLAQLLNKQAKFPSKISTDNGRLYGVAISELVLKIGKMNPCVVTGSLPHMGLGGKRISYSFTIEYRYLFLAVNRTLNI